MREQHDGRVSSALWFQYLVYRNFVCYTCVWMSGIRLSEKGQDVDVSIIQYAFLEMMLWKKC